MNVRTNRKYSAGAALVSGLVFTLFLHHCVTKTLQS